MNPLRQPRDGVMTHDARFRKEYRVRSGKDFDRAYRRRCRAGDRVLLVFGCANDLPHPRLGLSVSRKVGNAVVRNRWKRIIREAFRLSREDLPKGVDLIVIPRREVEPVLDDVRRSLNRLASEVAQKLSRPAKSQDDRKGEDP